MIIHTRNEHPNIQANKLKAKNHLHVQHSTNATTQGNCIKDIKSTRVRVLKVMHDKTTSTKLQGKGTNHKSLQKPGYIIN